MRPYFSLDIRKWLQIIVQNSSKWRPLEWQRFQWLTLSKWRLLQWSTATRHVASGDRTVSERMSASNSSKLSSSHISSSIVTFMARERSPLMMHLHEPPVEPYSAKLRPPKHNVVLCHGLFGQMIPYEISSRVVASVEKRPWRRKDCLSADVPTALKAIGVKLTLPRVPPTGSIAKRARYLRHHLETYHAHREVNLIAHSMGGLDARYLISHLRGNYDPAEHDCRLAKLSTEGRPMTCRILSLTTVATPHRGSSYMDHVYRNVIQREHVERVAHWLGLDVTGFQQLTTHHVRHVFNPSAPNANDVVYWSIGAEYNYQAPREVPLCWTFPVVLANEGPNDSVVSVNSAKWGHYWGTLEAHHFELSCTRRTQLLQLKHNHFDAARLYSEICHELYENGF